MNDLVQRHDEPSSPIQLVIDEMTGRLEKLQQSQDHRVIFQRVYLLMTKEMKLRLENGFFHDTKWMERVLVGFARYYFEAMDNYNAGRVCSPAWDLAFRQAGTGKGFVLEGALLGINAHINSDLPMVLYDILTEDRAWPDARLMFKRRQDHEQINAVLGELVDQVQHELALHHARFIRVIDWVMGRKDEKLSGLILSHCRTVVWHHTEMLLNAEDDTEREPIRRQIEQGALELGRQVIDLRMLRLLKTVAPITRRYRWF